MRITVRDSSNVGHTISADATYVFIETERGIFQLSHRQQTGELTLRETDGESLLLRPVAGNAIIIDTTKEQTP